VTPAVAEPLTGTKLTDGKPAPGGGAKPAPEKPTGGDLPGTVTGESSVVAPGKVQEIRNEIQKYGVRDAPLLDMTETG
jgi:hypothetical protein